MKKLLLCTTIMLMSFSISHADYSVYIAQGDTVEIRSDKEMLVHASMKGSGLLPVWDYDFTGAVYFQVLQQETYELYGSITMAKDAVVDTGSLIVWPVYQCAKRDTLHVIFTYEGDFNDGYDCNQEGDPVNPSTGNLFISTTDYMLPGRGLSVELTRMYGSLETENADTAMNTNWTRPLGYGWTHTYNFYFTLDGGIPYNSSWNLRLHMGNGNEYYGSWSNSAYTLDKGMHLSLARATGSDTTWTLKTFDGKRYFFKLVGTEGLAHLDSIKDNNNNLLKLTYTGVNLTKITDATSREVNITYSRDRIEKVYEPPNTSSAYFQYFYQKNGNTYELTRVEKHTNTSPDSTTVLDRYFYPKDTTRHLIKVHVLPTGKYGENNGSTWDSTKGDRINYWYDSKRRLKYEEVVKGDGDSNPSNDTVIYRAHFRYHAHDDSCMDSTVVYYEESAETVGARNPFTDTAAGLPGSKYYKRVYKLNTNGTIAWIRTDHPGTGLSYTATYGSYDNDYNPASMTDPDSKVTNYTWHSYVDESNATRYLNRAKKIKYATGDSVLYPETCVIIEA